MVSMTMHLALEALSVLPEDLEDVLLKEIEKRPQTEGDKLTIGTTQR